MRLTPAFSVASIMRSHSSTVTANGTSTRACFPALAAATTGGAWDPELTALMAWTRSSFTSSSMSANALTPWRLATSSAASGMRSYTPISSVSSIALYSSACRLPLPPQPTTPTPTLAIVPLLSRMPTPVVH